MGTAKLAVVIEDERELGGSENEVVVFVSLVIRRGEEEAPGHPEVDFQREIFFLMLESKEETFSVGTGVGKPGAGECCLNGSCRSIPKNAGATVGFDSSDGFSQSGQPNTAGEFDFGEFGHESNWKLRVKNEFNLRRPR
jgi:hypothetical protein